MRTGDYPDDDEWNRLKRKVLARDEWECQKCGSTDILDVDHITPISEGGPHKLNNLQVLCRECHDKKHPIQTKLREGIQQNRRIRMKYHANNGTRVRAVDPYGIGMYDGIQYFAGYDYYRNEIRFFRPKKAEWMEVIDVRFSPPENFDIDAYLDRNVTSRKLWSRSAASQESPCFIATAAYETPYEPQIDRLRAFRDTILLRSIVGTVFVKFYYRISPPIAEWISKKPWRQIVTRILVVRPAVFIADLILNHR
jgi:hypothetical protein